MMMMSSSPLSPRSFSMQNMNNANPMSMTNLDYHPGYQNSINSIRLSGVRDRWYDYYLFIQKSKN